MRPENGRTTKPAVQGEPATLLLLKRVLIAHEGAPLEEMEQLISLAREDEALRAQILEGTAEVLADDPDSLVPCWLALIAGELGPAGRDLLLSAVATSEGEALDETLVPILARHASEVFDRVAAALDDPDPDDEVYRRALYTVLVPLVLGGDEVMRERVRQLAARRLEAERSLPPPVAVTGEPLLLLAGLPAAGTGDSRETVLELARTTVTTGWRDTARTLERLFGSVKNGS